MIRVGVLLGTFELNYLNFADNRQAKATDTRARTDALISRISKSKLKQTVID
jgi:hypothetical protein